MEEVSEEEKAKAIPSKEESAEEEDAFVNPADSFLKELLGLVNSYSGELSVVEVLGVLDIVKIIVEKNLNTE